MREHWIRQARFLQEHRPDGDRIRFEVMDVYDLPELGLEPFDITIFAGLFYHLADPVSGLKIAADLTNELMIFDTATKWGMEDDSLVVGPRGHRGADAGRARPELAARPAPPWSSGSCAGPGSPTRR